MNIQISDAKGTLNRLNVKRLLLRRIIIKLSKVKEQENFESKREK
jgi:hypothetical protein